MSRNRAVFPITVARRVIASGTSATNFLPGLYIGRSPESCTPLPSTHLVGDLAEGYRDVISSGTFAASFEPGLYIGQCPGFQNPLLPTHLAGDRAPASGSVSRAYRGIPLLVWYYSCTKASWGGICDFGWLFSRERRRRSSLKRRHCGAGRSQGSAKNGTTQL